MLAVVEARAGMLPGSELADELVANCRRRLAHFKCPRRVEFVERLPRQDNGKIYKRLLRDRYRERAATSPSLASAPWGTTSRSTTSVTA